MSDKFQNKYRITSTRLQNWDYSWNAAYFITICTQNREHYFGEIENNKMVLSKQGILADVLWYEIQHHAKNIDLDEFVVMPNHIHGILILNGNGGNDGKDQKDDDSVETRHALSLQQPHSSATVGQKRFQNQGKNSVSSIIGSYKSAVTKHANRLRLKFVWQTRFHEHIIRNAVEYHRIKNYIANNPTKWKEDKFYKYHTDYTNI